MGFVFFLLVVVLVVGIACFIFRQMMGLISMALMAGLLVLVFIHLGVRSDGVSARLNEPLLSFLSVIDIPLSFLAALFSDLVSILR